MQVAETSNTRVVAARILARWLRTGSFPDRQLADVTRQTGFLTELVYGVVRHKRTLEWMIDRCASRRVDRDVLAHLLPGAYQILYMRVPAHAAVHATVEAAKAGRARHAAGFINGVLRELLRRRETLMSELARQSPGVRLSHPDLLVARWQARWGEEKTAALCAWNNGIPAPVLVPNPLRIDMTRFRRQLADAGVEAEPHPAWPDRCVVLSRGVAVSTVPGYAEGQFSVQDPATFTAVDLLGVRPGDTVLDACAAPGGKTVLLAEAMQDHGRLIATDVQADRVARLRENVERLGLSCVTPLQADLADAAALAALAPEGFDRVLLDAPCSNTGVLRRRPDARWRFSAERLHALSALQRRLLDAAWPLLKPGGRLVYSTCSLEHEENDAPVDGLLDRYADARGGDRIARVPPESRTDGAFAAVLEKKQDGTR